MLFTRELLGGFLAAARTEKHQPGNTNNYNEYKVANRKSTLFLKGFVNGTCFHMHSVDYMLKNIYQGRKNKKVNKYLIVFKGFC